MTFLEGIVKTAAVMFAAFCVGRWFEDLVQTVNSRLDRIIVLLENSDN